MSWQFWVRLFSLLALLVLVSGCGLIRSMSGIEKPEVEFTNVTVDGVDMEGIQLVFDFQVTNPNRRAISSERHTYTLVVGDTELAAGMNEKPLSIEGGETSTIQVPVQFKFSEITGSFSDLQSEDRISYTLETELSFDLPFVGSQSVTTQASGEVPNTKLPGVELAGFEISNFGFDSIDLEVQLEVNNPNPFAITLSGLSYDFHVNERAMALRNGVSDYTLPANSSRVIKVPLELNIMDAGSSIIDMIQRQNRLSYRFTGDVHVGADVPYFDGLQIVNFHLEGDLYDYNEE